MTRRPRRAGAGAARRRCRSRTAGHLVDARSVVSSSVPGLLDPLLDEPAAGLMPVSSRKRRVKVRTLIRACSASGGQVERAVEAAQRPGARGRRSRRPAAAGTALDELRLAAVAPRRDDAAPGRAVGHVAAVVARGRCAGTGRSRRRRRPRSARRRRRRTARRGQPTAGNSCAGTLGIGPVGGRRAAVEQPGGGQHERARADRHDPGAAAGCAARRRDGRADGPRRTGGPWTPATSTVSTRRAASRPWSGSTE